jgi:hypothetical protein
MRNPYLSRPFLCGKLEVACGHLLHVGCFEGQAKKPLEFCTVELAAPNSGD